MHTTRDIAQALLEIGAVGFRFDNPITFVSGIVSPVYVDNRKLPYFPEQWQLVLQGMQSQFKQLSVQPEIIAGIETAGIPHSSALGMLTQLPSVFIRKKPKDHGTKSKIEGGEVAAKHVLLIEDMVTTGGSSLRGVEALREAGAIVQDCLVITSYGFAESEQAFTQAEVRLHVLCPFAEVLHEAEKRGTISEKQAVEVRAWMSNPREWRG